MTHTIIAFLTAASAQAGSHKPDQVFVVCEITGRHPGTALDPCPFTGLLLTLATEEYVNPAGTSYFPQMQIPCGRLRMYTADDFAEHLLSRPESLGSDCRAVDVNIYLLRFVDGGLPSQLQVLGTEDQTFSTEEVTNEQLQDDDNHVNPVLEPSDHHIPLPPALDNSADTGDIDFTDFLMSAQGSSASRPNKRAKTSKARETKGPVDVDASAGMENQHPSSEASLLDDSELFAFLDNQDILEMKRAVEICDDAAKSSDFAEWRKSAACDQSANIPDSDSDGDEVVADGPVEGPSSSSSSSSGATAFQQQVRYRLIVCHSSIRVCIF